VAREHLIQQAVRKALSDEGTVRVFRNNSGVTQVPCSECKRKLCSACRPKFTYPITYGLGVGSADLVGLSKPDGRFFSIEMKAERGVLTDEQEAWGMTIRRFGGIWGVCRSIEDAIELVNQSKG